VQAFDLAEYAAGGEFMGSVTREIGNLKTYIRCGPTEIPRDQGIV